MLFDKWYVVITMTRRKDGIAQHGSEELGGVLVRFLLSPLLVCVQNRFMVRGYTQVALGHALLPATMYDCMIIFVCNN
jgi:hypothetical protein